MGQSQCKNNFRKELDGLVFK
uniref:Uncharacterized protein n=1 Tax=Arundo donax TaxID=35708 RepID=A0A0A9AMX9_ARUDO